MFWNSQFDWQLGNQIVCQKFVKHPVNGLVSTWVFRLFRCLILRREGACYWSNTVIWVWPLLMCIIHVQYCAKGNESEFGLCLIMNNRQFLPSFRRNFHNAPVKVWWCFDENSKIEDWNDFWRSEVSTIFCQKERKYHQTFTL